MNKIHCQNLQQFTACLYELTISGLRFEAYTGDFTIVLTGGY